MVSFRRSVITALLILTVLLSACGGKRINLTAPPLEQRLATLNRIVLIANDSAAPIVRSLVDAQVVSADVGGRITQYQTAVATATRGIADVLQEPGPWRGKAIRVQNLALSLIPPAGWEQLGVHDDRQVGALVAAINGIEAVARVIAELAKGSQ